MHCCGGAPLWQCTVVAVHSCGGEVLWLCTVVAVHCYGCDLSQILVYSTIKLCCAV